jgi:hypothetical protein
MAQKYNILHFSGGSHHPTKCVKCGVKLVTNGGGCLWTFNERTYNDPPDTLVNCEDSAQGKVPAKIVRTGKYG